MEVRTEIWGEGTEGEVDHFGTRGKETLRKGLVVNDGVVSTDDGVV